MNTFFCSHCGAYSENTYTMQKRFKFRQPKVIRLCLGCFFAYRFRYEREGFEIAEDVIMGRQ